MKIYLVGGAVRDKLLGIDSVDRDWVVIGADFATMLKQGYKQVGKDFPVFLHPKTHEEYALARTEVKVDKGYHGFKFDFNPEVSLEEDLIRRDLTINAIAYDVDNKKYIDPYHGIEDLNNRLLRHVSVAFIEDPLRILRVARFYCQLHDFNFVVADETKQLLTSMCRTGALKELSSDRVWLETCKVLSLKHSRKYFELLAEIQGLDYWYDFIEANELNWLDETKNATSYEVKLMCLFYKFPSRENLENLAKKFNISNDLKYVIQHVMDYKLLNNLESNSNANILSILSIKKRSSRVWSWLVELTTILYRNIDSKIKVIEDFADKINNVKAQDVMSGDIKPNKQIGDLILQRKNLLLNEMLSKI